MDALQILTFIGQFGANPSFWWMWESVGLFLYFVLSWSRKLGADKHVVLQWTGSGWRQVAVKWVKRGAKTWGKNKGRMNQPVATAYNEPGFFNEAGVQFTDIEHTLPLKVTFDTVKHNPVGKYAKNKDGTVKFIPGTGYSVNPSVGAMEEHLGKETAKQLHSMNTLGNTGLTVLIVVLAAGIMGGYIAYPFINQPHAIVQTATAITTTITQTLTHP